MLKSSHSRAAFPNKCCPQLTSRFLASIPNLLNQNLPKSSLETCVFKIVGCNFVCVCKFGKHCRGGVIDPGCTYEPPESFPGRCAQAPPHKNVIRVSEDAI